jgi:hypothetical protein
MTTADGRTTLVWLEGFLKAFEWFNHKTNHGCNFAVHSIPRMSDVSSALASYFIRPSSDFRLEPLPDFERELRKVFARFLFLFHEPVGGDKHGDYLIDPRQSFSLMDEIEREKLLDDIITVMRSLKASAAWRVWASQECAELREWCFQDDVVLELPEQICLLHFGVSD